MQLCVQCQQASHKTKIKEEEFEDSFPSINYHMIIVQVIVVQKFRTHQQKTQCRTEENRFLGCKNQIFKS